MVAQKRKASFARKTGTVYSRPYKRTRIAPIMSARPAGQAKLVGANLPFPNTLRKTLRYVETKFGLNPGVGGTTQSYVFTANGLYDPNITGTGHQPMGYDQLMELYDHYKVTHCKITATFDSIDTAETHIVGIKITDGGGYISSGQAACEGGNSTFDVLGTKDSSHGHKTLVYNLDLKAFFGGRNFEDRDFQGSTTTNPLEQAYPTVFCFPNSSADSAGCICNVVLEYATQFTEVKQLAQS